MFTLKLERGIENGPVHQILVYFIHYQNILHKMNKVACLISDVFGWTLVIFVLHTVIDLAYNFYWMFFYVVSNEAVYVLSMYRSKNTLFIILLQFICI